MDDAGRARVLECVQGLMKGFDLFTDYAKVSRKAMGFLIGDLAMWKSMNRTGPQVMQKIGELAKATGPHVERIFQAL